MASDKEQTEQTDTNDGTGEEPANPDASASRFYAAVVSVSLGLLLSELVGPFRGGLPVLVLGTIGGTALFLDHRRVIGHEVARRGQDIHREIRRLRRALFGYGVLFGWWFLALQFASFEYYHYVLPIPFLGQFVAFVYYTPISPLFVGIVPWTSRLLVVHLPSMLLVLGGYWYFRREITDPSGDGRAHSRTSMSEPASRDDSLEDDTMDGYPWTSPPDHETVHFEMAAKYSTDASESGLLYTLGELVVTSERVLFTSPRQVVDVSLDGIDIVQLKKDRFNRLIVGGLVGLLVGIVVLVFSGRLGFLLVLMSVIAVLIGFIVRGEELILVTSGGQARFRTINTEEGLEAAATIRELY